jgi:hypothetical protein
VKPVLEARSKCEARIKGGMGKGGKYGQLEAVSHIRGFLAQRGLQIPSRSIRVMNEENWLVFERGRRSVGVDREAGVWQKDSPDAEWICIEKPCTVGGAIMAADFLTQD